MKALPMTYKKNGMFYKLIQRNSTHAIYEQYSDEALEDSVGYEVITIIIFTEDKFQKYGGTTIPFFKGEYIPGNNKWGKKGWSYNNFSQAFEKFKLLSMNK